MKGKSSKVAFQRAAQVRTQGIKSPLIQVHRKSIRRLAAAKAAKSQALLEQHLKNLLATRSRLQEEWKRAPASERWILRQLRTTLKELDREARRMEGKRANYPDGKYPRASVFMKQSSRRAAAKLTLDALGYGYENTHDVSVRKRIDVLMQFDLAVGTLRSPSTKQQMQWEQDMKALIGKKEFSTFRGVFRGIYELLVQPSKDA